MGRWCQAPKTPWCHVFTAVSWPAHNFLSEKHYGMTGRGVWRRSPQLTPRRLHKSIWCHLNKEPWLRLSSIRHPRGRPAPSFIPLDRLKPRWEKCIQWHRAAPHQIKNSYSSTNTPQSLQSCQQGKIFTCWNKEPLTSPLNGDKVISIFKKSVFGPVVFSFKSLQR